MSSARSNSDGRRHRVDVHPTYEGVLMVLEGRGFLMDPAMALRLAAELSLSAQALLGPAGSFLEPRSDYDVHG